MGSIIKNSTALDLLGQASCLLYDREEKDTIEKISHMTSWPVLARRHVKDWNKVEVGSVKSKLCFLVIWHWIQLSGSHNTIRNTTSQSWYLIDHSQRILTFLKFLEVTCPSRICYQNRSCWQWSEVPSQANIFLPHSESNGSQHISNLASCTWLQHTAGSRARPEICHFSLVAPVHPTFSWSVYWWSQGPK